MAGPLDRYCSILDGTAKARFLITRDTKVASRADAEDAELWKLHDSSVKVADRHGDDVGRVSLLDIKVELARRMLDQCNLCERRCGARRSRGVKGHCGVLEPRVSSEFLHLGEEPDLVPSYTIFFSGCTFNCVFCQNWDISTRPGSGAPMSTVALARKIEAKTVRSLRSTHTLSRARNVNWVGGDPTSNLPFILEVLRECNANLPQVWNSNMYLTEEAMRLLDGVIDVYLTDFKYGNDDCAKRLSNAPNYLSVIKRNHLLGRAQAEMIIRHLVLPGHLECCTKPVLSWIAETLRNVKVNVMSQYRPEHRALEFPEISRPLRMTEYRTALEMADRLGLDLCD